MIIVINITYIYSAHWTALFVIENFENVHHQKFQHKMCFIFVSFKYRYWLRKDGPLIQDA